MKRRLEEERIRSRGTLVLQDFEKPVPEDIWDSPDQMQAEEFEDFEEELVDRATAAQTIQELEAEILREHELVIETWAPVHLDTLVSLASNLGPLVAVNFGPSVAA